MNALTLFALAAVAAYGSCSLGYPGVYGGYPGVYSGIAHHGYTGAHPVATYGSAVHTPLAYNHVAHAGYNTIPYAPIQSQYHAQDELGQYSFGYAGGPSARSETRDAFGVVRGSYNYVDSEGKVQTQHYVADALGFRVSGTNLPVSPDAPVAAPLAVPVVLPEPVQDTPEVAAAKAAHEAAYNEAAAAAVAAPDRKKRSVLAAHALGVYSPRRFSYGFSAPLSYGYPAYGTYHSYGPYVHGAHAYPAYPHALTTKDATLLRVVNNPGHAVSYRVD
ncbi:cuticle protein 21-like [Macrobrachium rosenbergii]|uniref:cuticle protein 21-like n=1 Tax=Macrobrachium rosenbergii TaxID=79674 RepID=UPI0034D5A6AC